MLKQTLAESLTRIECGFSTEFSTIMLKTSARPPLIGKPTIRKPPTKGGSDDSLLVARLSRNFLQQFLINIEVGVDILHIVMLFKSFHEPDHRVRRRTFQFDVILRNPGHTRRGRPNAGLLHALKHAS